MQDETVWLSLKQMADLFGRDKSVISSHLKNIFQNEELEEVETVAKFATVQLEGQKSVERMIEYYNLDGILSVGYRVNSKRGAQFCRWASDILKERIIKGYSIDKEKITASRIREVRQALDLLSTTLVSYSLTNEIAVDVINIIRSYAKTWDLLVRYDESRLTNPTGLHKGDRPVIAYDIAKEAINGLKRELQARNDASELFGIERDAGLMSILEI